MTEIKPGTPLPWRVEQDTDLIWGACNPDDTTSYGMGVPIVEGKTSGWTSGKPTLDEREANAAYIVTACNAYPSLINGLREAREALAALRAEVVASEEHGEGAADDSCPVCAAIERARATLAHLDTLLAQEGQQP